MDKIHLTPQQLAFMDTFGYLSFPGLLKDKIADIEAAFEAIWTERGGGMDGKAHSGKMRSVIVPFIDQSEYLSGLLDDPRAREADEGLRLREDEVSQGREARRDAPHGRVGQHAEVQAARLVVAAQGRRDLGHLHQGEDALVHPGPAPRTRDDHQR